MRATYLVAATACIATSSLVPGCARRDTSRTTAAEESAASGTTAVRGTVVGMSDSVLTVSSPDGDVRVTLAPPVRVYARVPADLSRVTERSFVGVTSVPGPDGRQRATEIHIFPEELRGTNEGSFLMAPQGGGDRSTMTNGTVAAPRMSNGEARMTNGAVRGQAGGTLTVTYRGGSQTIVVPAGVPVTAIVPTQAKLAAGSSVVVLAVKQPDGTLKASRVLLAGQAPPSP